MSQQEFVPEPESYGEEAGDREDDLYAARKSYYRRRNPQNEGVPKDEPPSSYLDSAISPGYRAQDNIPNENRGTYETNAGDQQFSSNAGQRQQFASEDDAYEQGFRPYNSYYGGGYGRGVPPYAQNAGYSRVRRRSPFRAIFLVLLLFLLIKPILIVAGLFLATIGGLLLFMLLMAFFIFSLGLFRLALRPGYRRGGRYWYRRGPWC